MADNVQYHLEKMIPELEELREYKIFNDNEITMIIEKRKQFEYGIAKIGKEKSDFLNYIEYELNLDFLRRKRIERMGLKKVGIFADYGGVKRIFQIFHRALLKFQGDPRFWLQYIFFAMKSGSNQKLNKIFSDAIKTHPYNTGFWILAAKWEYEQNAQVEVARVLFNRAIRINPDEPDLYVEYARMEFLYLEKIKQRFELRGFDKDMIMGNGSNGSIDVNELPLPDAESVVPQFLSLKEIGEPGTLSDQVIDSNPFLRGDIPFIITKTCLEKFPFDLEVYTTLLDLHKLFNSRTQHIEEIYSLMETQFPHNARVQALIAQRPLEDYIWEKKREMVTNEDSIMELDEDNYITCFMDSVRLFNEAILEDCSEELIILYAEFLTEHYEIISSNENYTFKHLQQVKQSVLELFHWIREDERFCTNSIFLIEIKALIKMKDMISLLTITKRAVSAAPESGALWRERINILIACKSLLPDKYNLDKITAAYEEAFTHISSDELEILWKEYVAFISKEITFTEDEFFAKVTEKPIHKFSAQSKIFIFRIVRKMFPDGTILQRLKEKLMRPPLSEDFLNELISWEIEVNSPTDSIRDLFFLASTNHGKKSHQIWMKWIIYEMETTKDYKYASNLYTMAIQDLELPEQFIQSHADYVNQRN